MPVSPSPGPPCSWCWSWSRSRSRSRSRSNSVTKETTENGKGQSSSTISKEDHLVGIPLAQLTSIQSEIDLLKKLDHPHIVNYIDFIRTTHYFHIILEFMENGSLATVCKKFALLHVVTSQLRSLLTIMIECHYNVISHRLDCSSAGCGD